MLSVVVPAHNAERYLRQCLESLQNQTLRDIEIICVDDGSSDGTLGVMRSFAGSDGRFKIMSGPNGGYGAACNRGLAAANGKYAAILEADDFADESFYSDLTEIAEREECDLVKSDFYRHADGEDTYVRVFPAGCYGRALTPGRAADGLFVFAHAPSVWGAVYRRELLDGIRFLETPGAAFQDTSFGVKVMKESRRAYFVNKAYVHYRRHAGQSVADGKNPFAVCGEFAEIERCYGLSPELVSAKYRRYAWNCRRLSGERKDAFLERFREEFAEMLNGRKGLIDPRLYLPGEVKAMMRLIDGRPVAF
jgi:glycosyltransferase involved in cell wall biosynthesis